MPANSFNPYPTLALFLLASTFLVIELNAQNANPAQRFQQFDRNNDGKVTRAEAGDPPWFDRFDRNGDDAIEQSELPGGNTANPDRRSAGTGDLKAPPEPAHTEHLNIAYDEIDGVDPNLLSLDLYVPDDDSTKRPVMIMIHGGGWRGGDKASPAIAGNKMRHFVGEGYIYASVNYRLSPPEPGQDGIKHPVHAQDCAKAIAWIHDHIGDYGGAPDQLHLMGHSAGAHLAAILATNERFLAAHDKDLSILKTNVLLDPAAIDIPRYIELVDGRAMTPLYHLAFGDDADNLRDASPQQNIAQDKSIPPTLLFYGGERMLLDQIAPPFTAALTKAGAPSQAVDTITLDHGQINSHIGMLDEPMTQLIMRLHSGEDASTFPASFDNSKKPPTTIATPDVNNAASTIPDIAYGDHDAQKLDLYLPANPDKAPVMLYVHGGGWRRGDKSGVSLKPAFFNDDNWIFASTNYRLLPEGKHPNNVNDVASAIAWLHENIADHGGDPEKIFIMGHSAGCHLVSLVATDERPLALHDLPLSTIKGVIANDTQAYNVARLMETNPSELYAQVFGEDPEAQRDASPFHHIEKDKGIPPFLILYSSGIGPRINPLRPVYANAFADTLRDAGIEATVIDGSDRDHGQINQRFGDPEDDKITGAAQAFLESLLNTETSSPTPLSFTRDYIPGTTDTKGNFMGGTETMRIIPHNDQLFAGLSFWTDQRGDDPFPGAQILVKSGPDEPWQVSKNIPGAIRVSAMETITFASNHEGSPLPNPVS
ncbi:MAG: alpha/beta fold hydrolase, partial [Verrucomicrobiota bacterium]